MEKPKKDSRCKNWAIIQYDESSPSNWRDRLNDLRLKWVESPLHDQDINEDGTPKKAHRHLIISFSSKKSYEQVKEISDMVSGVSPQPVRDMKPFVRYLLHMDNPEKAQYLRSDIKAYGGFDVDTYLTVTGRDKREVLKEMILFIRENHVVSFADFSDYVFSEKFDEWSEVLVDRNTLFIKEYIKSYAWKHQTVDPETGEVRYEGNFLKDGKR